MGDVLTLACEVSTPQLPADWFKDGVPLVASSSCLISRNGTEHMLSLPEVGPADAGQYTCRVAGKAAMAEVVVEGLYIMYASLRTAIILIVFHDSKYALSSSDIMDILVKMVTIRKVLQWNIY